MVALGHHPLVRAPNALVHLTPPARPCPLGKATVCLYEYKTENKVVCDETASDGTYVIPAPLGMELYAQVSLGSHITFLRSKASQPTYVYESRAF